MTVRSVTVEFLRFGDETGVLRASDDYIRTLADTPLTQVRIPVSQERLNAAMEELDYKRFLDDDADVVRARANAVFKAFMKPLQVLLDTESDLVRKGDKPVQIDIVTRANEIAQLPFEVLEEGEPDLIVTRRIRQPWPPPPLVHREIPQILFVWAAPDGLDVPADEHREALEELLAPFDGKGRLVEVGNATAKSLAGVLGKHEFTHVHFLVHGVKPARSSRDSAREEFRLDGPVPPQVFLALEDARGAMSRMSPERLAALFARRARPEAVTIATCHSAELNPVGSGATLAHAIHNAGVPVVVASQMALTTTGSIELVTSFLQGLAEGRDPRLALRDCRRALRRNPQAFYDRVAIVGYTHIGYDHSEILCEREFAATFRKLRSLSQATSQRLVDMGAQVENRLDRATKAEVEAVREEFRAIRGLLDRRLGSNLSARHREDLHGLRATSFLCEAEASFQLSRNLRGAERQRFVRLSRNAFRSARDAFRMAASITRDRHAARTRWLACEAVIEGSLEHLETEWFTAYGAAREIADRSLPRGRMTDAKRDALEEAGEAFASMIELQLLAPLVGYEEEPVATRACVRQLASRARRCGNAYLVPAMVEHLRRYDTWWGPGFGLDEDVVARAVALRDLLQSAS